jgi:predicted dehydrogenase
MNVGIIGCGNISDVYIRNIKRFPWLSLRACSDAIPERAAQKAEVYDIPKACTVEEMLADPGIELVVNLTPPAAHFDVSFRALLAGKHVYSEKPLAAHRDEGRRLLETAAAHQRRLGCAPDTFMGAAIQTARRLFDAGAIGRPVAACAFMLCHGYETWHPAPDFFYGPGGGPLFDMGPYYLTALVQLIGPVRRVSALAQTTFPERVIEVEARRGERIRVQVPTHVVAALEFEIGALCTLTMSFDVWGHHLPPLELYGESGSLQMADPNMFDGVVRLRSSNAKSWRAVPAVHGYAENSRGLGVADMARAIHSGRGHRASAETAYHVLDVMQAIQESAEQGRAVNIASRCERSERMPQGLSFGRLDE